MQGLLDQLAADRHPRVRVLRAHRFRSLCIMLCMVLTIAFAAALLSSLLDRAQHAPGALASHEHMVFSELSVEGPHVDHHEDTAGEDGPADHLTAGHHHHADGGSGLMANAPSAEFQLALSDEPQAMEPQDGQTGLHSTGPERPPKQPMMDA